MRLIEIDSEKGLPQAIAGLKSGFPSDPRPKNVGRRFDFRIAIANDLNSRLSYFVAAISSTAHHWEIG